MMNHFPAGEKVCWIAGAGEFCAPAFCPRPGDLVVAADGGLTALDALGIVPGVVLGDFDSLGHVPAVEKAQKLHVYPAEKDDTDMMLAVCEGLARGFRCFELAGGLGGRLAHSLANIQTLLHLARGGARGYLTGPKESVTVIADGSLAFPPGMRGYLSVFALGSAEGVKISGTKYEIENAALTNDIPLGISNQFTERPAVLTVERGALAVLWETQANMAVFAPGAAPDAGKNDERGIQR